MSRIKPEQWATFFAKWNSGYSKTDAARIAGMTLPTVRAGLRGDPGSSIHAYRKWKAAQDTCPACGRHA